MPGIQLTTGRRCISCPVLLIAAACGAGAASGTESFTSPDGEYTVEYPRTWVHYPEARSLYILNFPLDRMVREVLLPEHGAMITFASTHPKPKSLEEWIASDVKRRGVVERRRLNVDREGRASPLSVTETVSHSTRGSLEFEQVDWYFSIGGHLFDAVLLYHSGEPRGGEYRQVLREVVSSIKVGPG